MQRKMKRWRGSNVTIASQKTGSRRCDLEVGRWKVECWCCAFWKSPLWGRSPSLGASGRGVLIVRYLERRGFNSRHTSVSSLSRARALTRSAPHCLSFNIYTASSQGKFYFSPRGEKWEELEGSRVFGLFQACSGKVMLGKGFVWIEFLLSLLQGMHKILFSVKGKSTRVYWVNPLLCEVSPRLHGFGVLIARILKSILATSPRPLTFQWGMIPLHTSEFPREWPGLASSVTSLLQGTPCRALEAYLVLLHLISISTFHVPEELMKVPLGSSHNSAYPYVPTANTLTFGHSCWAPRFQCLPKRF